MTRFCERGAFCLVNNGPRVVRRAISGLHGRCTKVRVVNCQSKCVGTGRRQRELVGSVARGEPSIMFITVKSPGRRLLVRRVRRERGTVFRKLNNDFSMCANRIRETPG